MKVKVFSHDYSDKKIEIHVGDTGRVWVDYDDVDHDEADKIVRIIAKALDEEE